MTVESASYVNGLNASYPASSDQKSEGDNHLRLIKTTLLATFPNLSGAVTVTHSDINTVTAKANIASPTFTGIPSGPTAAPGSSTTQFATTEFVTTTSFISALPGQASADEGDILITDGVSTASWSKLPHYAIYQLNGII